MILVKELQQDLMRISASTARISTMLPSVVKGQEGAEVQELLKDFKAVKNLLALVLTLEQQAVKFQAKKH